MPKTIEEVVEELKRDPTHPVRAHIGGITVEVCAVPESPAGRSAAQLFAEVGPWAGEMTEEILALLAEARVKGGRRPVGDL